MATILRYMRSPKPKDNARVEVMRDRNIALRETYIDTGRNSQEDLLTTELAATSKATTILLRVSEPKRLMKWYTLQAKVERSRKQLFKMLHHGQDFFTRRSNSNEANSRNSSHSLCRTKQL